MGACTAARSRLLGNWVLVLVLSAFVSSLCLALPSVAVAQEEPAPAEDVKEDEHKLSANPIIHFFESIGIVFGIIFAAISVGTLALIIILAMDLRMGEAVSTAFVEPGMEKMNVSPP